MDRARELATGVLGVLLALGISSATHAASLSLGVSNATRCQTKTGGNSAFGSLVTYTSCQGSAAFGNGVMYNDAVATTSGGSAQKTLAIDGGLLVDAAGLGKRIHLRQELRFNITLEIDADPGEAWTLEIDQSVLGLFAILQEGSANSVSGVLGDHIDFVLGGTAYDVAVTPTALGSTATASAEFSGSRTDLKSGVGPTTLTGVVGPTTLEVLSQCPTCTGSGSEAALLFGLDDIGGALPVTADDYATWSRSVEPDGYNATFTLVPEASALTIAPLAAGALAAVRRRRGAAA